MKKYFLIILLTLVFNIQKSEAQEGIPIYHDYLSDNLFLLHPSMAGASSCAKVRLTGRMQWFDVQDNPMLQTFSFHTHLGENGQNGIGAIIFNDRNGYHSQKGIQLAFAHHINFGNGEYVNKLSFGLAGSFVQNQLDETSFDPSRFDPVVAGIVQSSMYYNLDFGFSYHVSGFFFNATLKNALLATRDLYSAFEQVNLRNYVASIGYYIGGNSNFHVEPSVLLQYKEYSGQVITDMNMKFYFNMSDDNAFYLGASYRKDWDDLVYQNIYHTITPILGLRINKLTFAYTYTYDLGETPISNSGFHQITLGYNFNCRKQLVRNGCPEVF
jgi:type IX secretion system PorP/SprF family membrane protein